MACMGGGTSGSRCLEVELGAGRLMRRGLMTCLKACRPKGKVALSVPWKLFT